MPRWWPWRSTRWLAIVALVLLPLVWVAPSVFGDRRFVPWDLAEYPPTSLSLPAEEVAAIGRRANHDVTEVPVWFLPEMEFARDELLAGRWPAWNPHARSGTVLHAHGLIGILYPPNWLAMFAAGDVPSSSALTQQRLGWKPTNIGLIADISRPGYFS